jgi:aspartate racemase
MKKIGIIGGIGPESTIDYYKRIIGHFQSQTSAIGYPEIIIYSANVNELLLMVEQNDWPGLTTWLVDKIRILHTCGADFAVIGSNTPHVVFDEVKRESPLPLLSIVEETCQVAREMNLKRLGLLGTWFTMQSEYYKKPFHDLGIEVVVPENEDQKFIHQKLFDEVELGIIKDTTRTELLWIIQKLISRHKIDGVLLGCTELPLILNKSEFGVPFLNTTAIHVESIIRYAWNVSQS